MNMHNTNIKSSGSHNVAGKLPLMSRLTSTAKRSMSNLPSMNSKQGAKAFVIPAILAAAVGGYFLFRKFRGNGRSMSDLDLIGHSGMDSSTSSSGSMRSSAI